VSFAAFPQQSRTRWRRLDVPGWEDALLERVTGGFRLSGELQVEEVNANARLAYAIECAPDYLTQSARIEGVVDGVAVRLVLAADQAREWTEGGVRVAALSGALDLDLGFTPATNVLPIRRLNLAVGHSAAVRSAWLRFPELRLEPLEQTYTREAPRVFRYRALVDEELFTARLDTDEFGRVRHYENLWEVEAREGPRAR
jgi:uncharacterized protein